MRKGKAKLYNKKRYSEKVIFLIILLKFCVFKVQMRKLIKQHEEKKQKSTVDEPTEGAVPTYLLDRQRQAVGKALSSAVKQKRKEKAVGHF